jgi:hypothetical protein
MCDVNVRNVGALMHNMMVRWPEGKSFVKLNDLRKTVIPDSATALDQSLSELLTVAQMLADIANSGMSEDRQSITWTPAVTAAVSAIAERVKAALDGVDKIKEAHFHDSRHSSGEENILRVRAGSRWAGFIAPDYKAAAYDYTVKVVSMAQFDTIQHVLCGTHLLLHEHFLADMRRDPAFFGKVWCPVCGVNAPITQFSGEVLGTTNPVPHVFAVNHIGEPK